jgi:hypothetical protein
VWTEPWIVDVRLVLTVCDLYLTLVATAVVDSYDLEAAKRIWALSSPATVHNLTQEYDHWDQFLVHRG